MKRLKNEHGMARGFLRSAIMLIPNFLKLLFRLFKDPRVPLTEKALLIGAIAYVISPIDLIPDFIPFVGDVDDLYLVSLVILRMLARTEGDVLQEHWDGGGNLAATIAGIERAARYVLPKKIRTILLGRVEIAPQIKGGLISSDAVNIEEIESYKRRKK
ncbi:MAG: DUF1232 domain-containing protein [Blastocatellia bacterium]|nr:DUF1232 domain-containing protein [Blastocatellia bacterium]